MVDFHTFLQDVLETGGIDMGMYLFEFSLRVLKISVVTCSNVQGCGSEKAKQAFFISQAGFFTQLHLQNFDHWEVPEYGRLP